MFYLATPYTDMINCRSVSNVNTWMNTHEAKLNVIRYMDTNGFRLLLSMVQFLLTGYVVAVDWIRMVWSTSFSSCQSGRWTCHPSSPRLWSNNILWWKVLLNIHFRRTHFIVLNSYDCFCNIHVILYISLIILHLLNFFKVAPILHGRSFVQ